ncbi:MAG: hypothetical protein HY080_04570 [Gammaproteobacteria bacterium]|nr:hypothetical protein [Gammaproteobacteria bacterium]
MNNKFHICSVISLIVLSGISPLSCSDEINKGEAHVTKESLPIIRYEIISIINPASIINVQGDIYVYYKGDFSNYKKLTIGDKLNDQDLITLTNNCILTIQSGGDQIRLATKEENKSFKISIE